MDTQDRLLTHLVARLGMVEAALCLLWNSHPDKDGIKAAAELIATAREVNEQNDPVSDQVLVDQQNARQASFHAIFAELPPAIVDGAARTA